MSHGRVEEAVEVLAAIEGKPANDPFIATERNEIEYSIQYERENAVRWRDILLRRTKENDTKTLRRLILGAGTQFIQQFEGIK